MIEPDYLTTEPSDHDLDRRLRQWGGRARRQAADTPTMTARPDAGVRLLARPAVRRWILPAAAALVAAAIVVPIALSRPGAAAPPFASPAPAPSSSTAAIGTASSARSFVPAVGTKPVAYHGLTVDVPSSWPINASSCGPQQNTVLFPVPTAGCGVIYQTVTTVQFQRLSDLATLTPSATSSATRISGVDARQASGAQDQPLVQPSGPDKSGPKLWIRAIAVPSRYSSVVITSPDRALADRIAATARLVEVDPSGCALTATDTFALPAPGPAAVPGAAAAVLPGRPESVRLCHYDNGLLEQGVQLSATQTEQLQRLTARAPAGTFRNPQNNGPSVCRDPALALGESNIPYTDGEGYRIVASYPDGSMLIAIARISYCGELGISNGSHVVQPTQELAQWLAVRTGGGSWSGSLPGPGGVATTTPPSPTG